MDERKLQILTASKDYTVGLSQISDSGLVKVRNYDCWQNVVKTVRWRHTDAEPVLFAAAGNDCDLHIMDVRTHTPCTVIDAHKLALTTVAWHPTKEELLMTYGFDRYTHLYDVRQNKEPVRVWKTGADFPCSHRPSLCGNIFSGDGELIVGPGDKNVLHVLSVATGALLSSTFIGFSASSLLLDGRDDSLIAADGKAIWVLPKTCYSPK